MSDDSESERIDRGELQEQLTRAGTTVLTGKPPNVSSLPMTSSWHISMAAWSCCDSSPVACRPCRSCWALEPGEQERGGSEWVSEWRGVKRSQVSALTGTAADGPVKELRHAGSQGPEEVRREAPGFQQG